MTERPAAGRWPIELLLIRHGESTGNVARDAAEAQGLAVIDIALRDMDVPLSDRGSQQAVALGAWLRERHADAPDVVFVSPYVRAEMTARTALESAGYDAEVIMDERLREREFGALDRLTRLGIEQQFPDQAAARKRLGKFYHRPPGGESWADVALRVRSAIDSISREHADRRVMVVAHEVVILMFRYVLEHLSEREILDLNRGQPLANCSVTSFDTSGDGTGMTLRAYDEVSPLERQDAPVTHEADRAPASS